MIASIGGEGEVSSVGMSGGVGMSNDQHDMG